MISVQISTVINLKAHLKYLNIVEVQGGTMQSIFLILVGLVYFMYAYLAFGSKLEKAGTPFFVCSMVIGFLYSLLWYWSARIVQDKSEYFLFVLIWDLVYISVFYFTPVVLFGVKLDVWGILGLVIMVSGLLVMKIGH